MGLSNKVKSEARICQLSGSLVLLFKNSKFQPNCQRVVEPRMTDPEIVNWLAAMDLQIADPNALSLGLGTAMTADYNNEKSSMVREEVYKNGILGS